MPRKRDPDSLRSQGVDRHRKPRVVFHLDEALYDALLEMVAESRRTLTAEIVLALELAAQARGYWPAKEKRKKK